MCEIIFFHILKYTLILFFLQEDFYICLGLFFAKDFDIFHMLLFKAFLCFFYNIYHLYVYKKICKKYFLIFFIRVFFIRSFFIRILSIRIFFIRTFLINIRRNFYIVNNIFRNVFFFNNIYILKTLEDNGFYQF